MDTSATWLLNTAADSLGFMLADAGYDVWLANSRGNRYTSRAEAPWDFDFDEMAYYDIPATLTYITSKTGVKHVSWVGHSQGCAISFAAFAKAGTGGMIDRFAALAPVTFLKAQSSPLMKLMADAKLDTVLKMIPSIKFLPSGPVLSKLLGSACSRIPGVCDGVASGLFGATGPNLPKARTDVYFGHFPDGTSSHNIAHWVANTRSGVFANMAGDAYDLKPYATSTAIWVGSKDMLGDPTDVHTLTAALGKNVVSVIQNDFSHMDFTWSPNAAKTVYAKVIAFLNTGSTA